MGMCVAGLRAKSRADCQGVWARKTTAATTASPMRWVFAGGGVEFPLPNSGVAVETGQSDGRAESRCELKK